MSEAHETRRATMIKEIKAGLTAGLNQVMPVVIASSFLGVDQRLCIVGLDRAQNLTKTKHKPEYKNLQEV